MIVRQLISGYRLLLNPLKFTRKSVKKIDKTDHWLMLNLQHLDNIDLQLKAHDLHEILVRVSPENNSRT